MEVKIDFLPAAETIRTFLSKCPECNCRNKYFQIYRYGRDMKIRCPKCNFFVVEDCEQRLIASWNKPRKIISAQ